MNTTVVLLAYLGIAAFVAVWVLYHGVVLGRPVRLFTLPEQLTLGLACLAVGAVWILFLPGLAVLAIRGIRRSLDRGDRGWLLHAKATRARS